MFPGHRPGHTLEMAVLGTWACSMDWAGCGSTRVAPVPQRPGVLPRVSSMGAWGGFSQASPKTEKDTSDLTTLGMGDQLPQI